MSILQADGIEFGNGTSINTKYFVIPQYNAGTPHEMFFYQSAAPTGWTKSTSHNNKALRVVTDNGRGTGGSSSFTSIFNSTNSVGLSGVFGGSVGNTTLTLQQIPAHNHAGGSSFTATSSAGSSPFRQPRTQPRSYSNRAETRVRATITVAAPDRQPRRVPDSNFTNPPARSRIDARFRQRRDFRSRSGPIRQRRQYRQPDSNFTNPPVRSRRPFTVRVAVPQRSRNPFTVDVVTTDRRDGARQPFNFRQRVRRNPRRAARQRRSLPARRRVRRPVTERNRVPVRQRRQLTQANPVRQRRQYQQPRSYFFTVDARNRNEFRQRRDANNRGRYPFRQRRQYQQPRTYNFTVDQRNEFFYRQPRRVRTPQRYIQTNNTQVPVRSLVPGGTIRGVNTQAPATSSSGGGQAHNHGFTGSPFTESISLSLRLQYIDVILCSFN